MAEDLQVKKGTRKEMYKELLPQVAALLNGEKDAIANMGNVCAALKETFGFLWVGFYIVKKDELVLGPFQGPVACTRIARGKGVCGTAWEQGRTIIVPDVDKFPGHIACSSRSKSEVVVPVFNTSGSVVAVLDVDSEKTDDFSDTDKLFLEQMVQLIEF